MFDQTGSEEVSRPTPTECYYDYDSADIQSTVNILWNHLFNSEIWSNYSDINVFQRLNDVWLKFLSPLCKATDEFVPLNHTFQSLERSKRYPRRIRRALSKKHKYWKAYKKKKLLLDKGLYCYQAALCKKLIFDYKKSKEQQIILKSNLGAFYRYVNKKCIHRLVLAF